MGSVRRWLAARTLRGRLIAGLLALLALACAAVGLVTYLVLSHTLINQLDLQLQAAGGRYASCMEAQEDHEPQPPGTPQGNCNKTPGLGPGTFGARVKDGRVTNQGIINGTSHLSAADQAKLVALPPDGEYYTLDLSSIGGDYRVTAVPGRDHEVLITGLPLSDMEATLRRVEIAEVAAFSAALVLTGLLGTGFVRLSLGPLRRVAATATRVTQLPLASGQVTLPDRVPDANPRTEVGQVGAAFNRMLGHVEEAALTARHASEARLRRGFAADASHELRTPLAAIRGYAELALTPPRDPVPDDIEHALRPGRSRILPDERPGRRTAPARPGSTAVEATGPRTVDLTRLAIDATSDARAVDPGHRWLLELPDQPVEVRGDEHRLLQVLANLMSNAAQAHPTRQHRHRRPDHHQPGRDGPGTGPGTVHLGHRQRPRHPTRTWPSRLFERFVRGDTARTRQVGRPPRPRPGHRRRDRHHRHGAAPSTSTPSPAAPTRFTITLPQLGARNWPRTSVHSRSERPDARQTRESSRRPSHCEDVLTPQYLSAAGDPQPRRVGAGNDRDRPGTGVR